MRSVQFIRAAGCSIVLFAATAAHADDPVPAEMGSDTATPVAAKPASGATAKAPSPSAPKTPDSQPGSSSHLQRVNRLVELSRSLSLTCGPRQRRALAAELPTAIKDARYLVIDKEELALKQEKARLKRADPGLAAIDSKLSDLAAARDKVPEEAKAFATKTTSTVEALCSALCHPQQQGAGHVVDICAFTAPALANAAAISRPVR